MKALAGLVLSAALLRVCGSSATSDANPSAVATAPSPSALAGLPGSRALPPPRHGGVVQPVGANSVEVVAARNGGVALFFMDAAGQPVPASQVTLPTVTVMVNGAPREVPVQVSNGNLVARVTIPAGAPLSVMIPQVVISGVVFEQIVVPTVVVVAALPTIFVVPAVQVVVPWHGKHRKFRGGWRWH